jgi:hypothetical protein
VLYQGTYLHDSLYHPYRQRTVKEDEDAADAGFDNDATAGGCGVALFALV